MIGFFKKRKNNGIYSPDMSRLPRHIGIIMDGNGRWAKSRGLARSIGHAAGAEAFKRIVLFAASIGIEYLTVYAFSTENWKRPPDEVGAICRLFGEYIKEAELRLEEEQVRLRFIGDPAGFGPDLYDEILEIEKKTAHFDRATVNIAINYGGRAEIVEAVRSIAADVAAGLISPGDIDEGTIEGRLYTAGQPDPDLIIRPSGEMRLSNFLMWQSAYSEFWFSNVMWPDFSSDDLLAAICEYQKRTRRFGGL